MAERELIASIERALASRGERVALALGDDAAVVRSRPFAVTSLDTVVDGVHFDLETHSPGDVGHKALATALSDLAAMGAAAGEAYVALALPEKTGTQHGLGIVEAMEALAERTGVTIAGGDVVSSALLVVSVTVVGWADRADALVYRGGARAGDHLAVSGALGGSGAGLLLLEGVEASLDDAERGALIGRHRRPEPRLELGRALAGAGASAMIDLSDGVATDAAHLAERSGVEITIGLPELPLAPGVDAVARASGRDPHELAATAGEDYELLLAAPPERRQAIERAASDAGARLAWVGEARAGTGLRLLASEGRRVAGSGYEHLA